MTIDTVRTQIAALQAAIPGITRAFDQLPRHDISVADLPAFVNFVREGVYNWTLDGATADQDVRKYVMWLLVLPHQEGLSDGEAERRVEPFVPTVRDYFAARPKLGGAINDVKSAVITGDSGPRQLIYADTVYWGAEFQLTVTERLQRVYAANE
jgi:hypothetical protein